MRAVAISPEPETLLDHIGVLAAILKIPLFVTEEKTYELAKTLYPQTDTHFVLKSSLNSQFLADNFDIIFVSSIRWMIEMVPLFPLIHNKKMRLIYVPHGNSDKTHAMTKECHAPQDISLIYGDHMRDLLTHTGMLSYINTTIVTGNYRRLFFEKHRSFYTSLAEAKVFSKLDRSKKTIFYAPTWSNIHNPSSFFDSCAPLIEQLPPSFNLLIKLHPYLFEHNDPARTTALYERYKDHPQVLFLEDFPPIYPLLSLSDIYLGDFSSIGYDFLSFNKPLYFFNYGTDRGSYLHRTGLPISTKENVFTTIEKTLSKNQKDLAKTRKEVYNYTFGKQKSFAALKKDIWETIIP